MYTITRWKKLTNHERNTLLQKLKLPYESVRNQYFTGKGRIKETPCTLDEVLRALNAALPPEDAPPAPEKKAPRGDPMDF